MSQVSGRDAYTLRSWTRSGTPTPPAPASARPSSPAATSSCAPSTSCSSGSPAAAPERSIVLTGLRGVGKTVLLNALRSAAVRADWGTGKLEARPDQWLRRPLAAAAAPGACASSATRAGDDVDHVLGVIKAFAQRDAGRTGAKLRDRWQPGIDAPAVTGRADSGDIEIDLVELLTDIGGLAADVGKGVAVFIDEMQDLGPDDVSALCAACHEISQSGLPVIVVGAGLPHLPAVLSASKSYSRAAVPLLAHRPARPRDAADRALRRPGRGGGRRVHARGARRDVRRDRRLPVLHPGLRQGGLGRRARLARSPPRTSRVAAPEAESELAVGFFGSRFERATPGGARVPAGHGRRRLEPLQRADRRRGPDDVTAYVREGGRARGGADVRGGGRAGAQAAVALAGARRAAQEGPDLLRRARPDRLHRAALRPLPAHPVLSVRRSDRDEAGRPGVVDAF